MSDVRQSDLTLSFLSGPGEALVPYFLAALSACEPFAKIFGPAKTKKGEWLSWADYPRDDWSIRQLPAVNVYEGGTETKQSPNGFLEGSLQVVVFWAPNLRRSDVSRMPAMFQAALLNFLESDACRALLDPHPAVNVDTKVPGLNRLGAEVNWSPNTEGIVEDELVPVTMVEVRYRVDLRRWYQFLESEGRTMSDPFRKDSLADFTGAGGEYDGVDGNGTTIVSVTSTMN